jgi:acetyl-CoA synthetase
MIDDTIAALSRRGYRFDDRGRVILPAQTNIAADTVGRFARGAKAGHPALVFEDAGGGLKTWSFRELDDLAARFASSLAQLGVGKGTPVVINTGQRPETAIAHLAVYRLGAIAATLSQLYGPDTVRHILRDSGARIVLTESAVWDKLRHVEHDLPQTLTLIDCGEPGAGLTFARCVADGRPDHAALRTSSEDPAILLYTSGSTGLPKGLLHGHRVLQSYLHTVDMFYELQMDETGLRFWTPADWAWVGGLLDCVLPAWAHGHTVYASQHRFDSEWAFDFMARHAITHAFMTPTALKRLAEVAEPRRRWNLKLRVVCTGGESLPSEIVRWSEEALGAVCNEFYGLTEFNHLVGNCKRLYPIKAGSMGRFYPGHAVRIVDEQGQEVAPGEVGEIVASTDDPTLFLGYWGDPGIPDRLRLGPWVRTNDLARQDADGYVWYQGRNDDLIKSAGYRIGPAEVEDALVRHAAVAEAAVVASPDPQRGSIVKAFVRVKPGVVAGAALAEELQDFVKRNLAAYKYPREVEFVDDFPLTSSGKIRRGELRRREIERKAGRAAG